MAYTTINKSTDYFNTVTYQGSGGNNFAISSLDFAPNLTWIKRMTSTQNHFLFDTVRGNNKYVNSNTSGQEYTEANSFTFDSNGFTFPTYWDALSDSSGTTAAWNWKANGTGVANTDGSISSTVSANTTSGFSIVSYTGTSANATVGHGLGSAPKLIIAKNLDSSGGSAEHWTVFHNSLDTNKNLYLNLTNAEDTPSPEIYRKGSFTNNVFAIGAHDRINKSGEAMIAYCFADVQGFSKFGSYTGNGNDDGTFIYTGFKPAFIMIKATGLTENWWIMDSKRSSFNIVQNLLQANSPNAELVGNVNFKFDMLSNGFKLRDVDGAYNNSGQNYIYMAFAEEPLVGDNPATAR